MQFKAECVTKTSNKIIVFEERRSKLTLINDNEIELSKILIDGCQIKQGLRCDYMFLESDKENYIELKGHNLSHALLQIKKTIELCSENRKESPKRCFIICSRVPIASAAIQNLRLKFKKEYNSELMIVSSPYKFNL